MNVLAALGIGLVLAIMGSFLSDREWVKVLCYLSLAIYAVALAVAFALVGLKWRDVFVPSVLLIFALVIHEAKRMAGRFK